MHAWKNQIGRACLVLKKNIVRHKLIRGTFLLVLSGLTVKIIGGLNWGLIGLLGFDLVAAIFGAMSLLSKIVYILVGLSAVYVAIDFLKKG